MRACCRSVRVEKVLRAELDECNQQTAWPPRLCLLRSLASTRLHPPERGKAAPLVSHLIDYSNMAPRSSASSRSPSPTPSESRINLPPGTQPDYNLEPPNVLADRVLGLHTRPANTRKGSWLSAFADEGRSQKRGDAAEQADEQEQLLEDGSGDEPDGATVGGQEGSERYRTRSRKRSRLSHPTSLTALLQAPSRLGPRYHGTSDPRRCGLSPDPSSWPSPWE